MIRSDTPAVPHRGNQLAANTATVLLVAALGYACAKLIIGFLPHSVGSAPLEPTRSSASPTSGNRATAVERAASARLFGDAGATPEIAKAEPAKEAPVTTLNLRLLGVLATDDSRPAYAIINGGGGEQVLGIGDEIERAVLREIHTAHVIIENRGKLERLELPKLELDGAAVAPVAAAQTSSPAISNSAEGGQGLVNVNDLPQTPHRVRRRCHQSQRRSTRQPTTRTQSPEAAGHCQQHRHDGPAKRRRSTDQHFAAIARSQA